MRKLLLSLACMAFMTGLVVAAEYTVVSYKDKTLTLKDKDGKEVTAKVTDKTKVYKGGKGGTKEEGNLEGLEKMLSNEKAVGAKVEATIEGGKVTEIQAKGRGKGKKKDN